MKCNEKAFLPLKILITEAFIKFNCLIDSMNTGKIY